MAVQQDALAVDLEAIRQLAADLGRMRSRSVAPVGIRSIVEVQWTGDQYALRVYSGVGHRFATDPEEDHRRADDLEVDHRRVVDLRTDRLLLQTVVEDSRVVLRAAGFRTAS